MRVVDQKQKILLEWPNIVIIDGQLAVTILWFIFSYLRGLLTCTTNQKVFTCVVLLVLCFYTYLNYAQQKTLIDLCVQETSLYSAYKPPM